LSRPGLVYVGFIADEEKNFLRREVYGKSGTGPGRGCVLGVPAEGALSQKGRRREDQPSLGQVFFLKGHEKKNQRGLQQ